MCNVPGLISRLDPQGFLRVSLFSHHCVADGYLTPGRVWVLTKPLLAPYSTRKHEILTAFTRGYRIVLQGFTGTLWRLEG